MAGASSTTARAAEVSPRDTLLATKLHVPRLRRHLIARPRLLTRLDEAREARLLLVSAPAGFGKTTLLADWILQHDQRAAWLSLDAQDNDPPRFWRYLLAALHTLQPGIGEDALAMLRSPQPYPIDSVLTVLINELAALPDAFALVLDDYHVIESQPIHHGLAFLLDHLPEQMRLVLAGRADPPLPLARLRARHQVAELRAADLRCTSSEAAVFLHEVMGLRVSAEDVAALEARTEGWIAGLQLAALAMRDQADLAGFVVAFTGSHRHILDYLTEEVLAHQPQALQRFLLETSILDRLTGPLCDAVTGQHDGQAMLEALERDNLFVVPLDEERRWYRYHHLFCDVLRHRLRRGDPARVPELHLRAAAWYERQGLLGDAIDQVLAARDYPRAARLIEQNFWALSTRGETGLLLRWLDTLPPGLVRSRPHLSVATAITSLFGGRLDAVEPHLEAAERLLPAENDAPPEIQAEPWFRDMLSPGNIAVVRAGLAHARGDVPRAMELARRALALLPADDVRVRSWPAWMLGLAYWRQGDLQAAGQVFGELSQLATRSHAARNVFGALLAVHGLGQVQVVQGRLREAAETYRRALRTVTQEETAPPPPASPLYVDLGDVLREWNDLDAAEQHVIQGIALATRAGDGRSLGDGYAVLARVRQACADAAGARDAIERARRLLPEQAADQVVRISTTALPRLWLAQGDVAPTAAWVRERGLGVDDELSYAREAGHVLLARVLLAQARPEEAQRLLDRLLDAAEAGGRTGSKIELLVLQARAWQALGADAPARAALARALTLAEPEGYVRIFVDEGAALAALLRSAAAGGATQAYARRLLAAMGQTAEERAPAPTALAVPAAQPLPEPLTERELEVLHLLAAGLSNQDIAARLFLALPTVKRHVGHILGKLDATSRGHAVARARELGLIP